MEPTLKFKIIHQLKEQFDDLSPRLKLVAKYITDHSAAFGLDSIRTTSEKIGISTFTLVRMAKVLGFDSFEALRDPFRTALVSVSKISDDSGWLREMSAKGEIGQTQAKAASNTIMNVQESLRLIDLDQMERVIETLFAAKVVYVSAVRATYSLAYFFYYIGRMSLPSLRLIPTLISSPIDELNEAGAQDVLIAITFYPYSTETIEAFRFAVKRGAKVILITDSNLVVPELEATEVLVVSTFSSRHFSCYSGAMALLENLIALMENKGGQRVVKRIKAYSNLRDEYSAYWKSAKKH